MWIQMMLMINQVCKMPVIKTMVNDNFQNDLRNIDKWKVTKAIGNSTYVRTCNWNSSNYLTFSHNFHNIFSIIKTSLKTVSSLKFTVFRTIGNFLSFNNHLLKKYNANIYIFIYYNPLMFPSLWPCLLNYIIS